MPAQKVSVLGVSIDNYSKADAVNAFDRMIQAPARRTHAISIINAHSLNLAFGSADYRQVLNESDLVFGDGTGVRMAARQRGVEMQDNLVGTDLIPEYFLARADRGLSMYLLGATTESVDKAAQYCERTFKGWKIAGYRNGFIDENEIDRVINEINDAAPDVLLVAMGNPLQESWIHRHKSQLGVPVCVGVGGLFDHWAGNLRRAPGWVRRLGIEWLQILLQQPHKWRRYLVGNLAFLIRIRRGLKSDRGAMRVRETHV